MFNVFLKGVRILMVHFLEFWGKEEFIGLFLNPEKESRKKGS